MRTRIVAIGNSQGIRIPKPLLEQSGLVGDVVLEVRPGEIVIRAPRMPREGWEEAARLMAAEEDDEELKDWLDLPNSWDDEEWEWE